MTKSRSANDRGTAATKKPPGKPTMKKSPASLVALFESTMEAFPDVDLRKVFGYPCGFVHGHMTVGIHADAFFVRLSVEDQEILLKKPGGGYLEPMPGRPMKEYVVLLEPVFRDPKRMNEWLGRSFQYTSSLQPKEPRGKGKR